MKIIVDTYAIQEVKSALRAFNPDIANLSSGTFWIRTEDEELIAVFVAKNNNRLYELQSQLFEAQSLTRFIYLVIIMEREDKANQLQLLSIQELGVFTLLSLSSNLSSDLNELIKFVSNPNRRKEKKLLPSRNIRFFTSGEQIILSIPNIGIEKLKILLKHFGGSIAWALSALTKYDLLDEGLKGITASDISNCRDALGLADGQILIVDQTEE